MQANLKKIMNFYVVSKYHLDHSKMTHILLNLKEPEHILKNGHGNLPR